MSRWFRFYDEALNDPKVQRLDPFLFKAWVNLLCLASQHGGRLPGIEDIAFALRLSQGEAETVLSFMISAGLVDQSDDELAPHNWNARQFKSDVSTKRVRKHREAKARNVSETPPDTETETDPEIEISPPPAAPANENKPKPSAIRIDWADFDAFWLAYPRKVDKKAAKRVWEREVRKGVRPELITIAARRYGELMKDSEPQFVKHPSTWLNATEFEDDRLWPNDPRVTPDLTRLTPSQRAMIEGLRLVAEET